MRERSVKNDETDYYRTRETPSTSPGTLGAIFGCPIGPGSGPGRTRRNERVTRRTPHGLGLRKLPHLQTPKRQLEGSEPSDVLSRQILQADVGTGPYRRSGPQYRSRVDIPELQPAALTSVVAVRLVV